MATVRGNPGRDVNNLWRTPRPVRQSWRRSFPLELDLAEVLA
jgi:hypothetical protein